MDKLVFEVNSGSIRSFLEEYHVGKKKIYDLFMQKAITINGDYWNYDKIIKDKSVIEIDLSKVEFVDFVPWEKELDVVYEDNDVLVVNKPMGVIIHPDSHEGNNTLVNMVSNYYLKNNISRCVRYVHRIDTDTTGLILFSKHFLAQSKLDYDMQEGTLERKYLALCSGNPKNGTINKNIGRDRHSNKMICYIKGQTAITKYQTLKTNNSISLCDIKLETGRTHQIRVHFQSINHSLLGDNLYGGNTNLIKRVALHSYYLNFLHPLTNTWKNITIELPNDMQEVVDKI